ncbi:MAG: hypothetical protein WC643_01490 [Parcubacteria group bacterium]|jgi:hypothetical protein
MSFKKILLISILFIVGVSLILFIYFKFVATPAKEATPNVVYSKYGECIKNFDTTKFDLGNKEIWSSDELGYRLLNFKIMESLSNENEKGCLDFQNIEAANSLFSFDFCHSSQKNIQMLYDFVEKIKQGMPEDDFVAECQSVLLNKMNGFKSDVPENLWNERSRLFCKNIYLSYQKSVVVLDDAFVSDSTAKNAPTCDCFDEEGKQRTCQNEFCGIMEFFVAVSKNDQSLCPESTEVSALPFCNFYFDKQYLEKYKNIFKKLYCREK